MKNERITVRLPVPIVKSLDAFVNLGEFSCRSDIIRQALSKFIDEDAERIIKKAEKIQQITKLEAVSKALEEYNKE